MVGQTAAAVGMAAVALSTQTAAGMLAAMFTVGACVAPTFITSSALLDDIARMGSLAWAYTVMVAVVLIGVAAGSALGDALGARSVPLISGSVLAVVVLWITIRMPSLIVAPQPARNVG